jgi:hypothetical protein
MRHFYSDIPVALYCAIFQPLYLPELPLAEGIPASDLEGMQGTSTMLPGKNQFGNLVLSSSGGI